MAASTCRSSQHHLLQPLSPSSRFASPKTPSSSFTTSSSSSSSPTTLDGALTSRFTLIPTIPNPKRICLCSPSTHPGAFRCKFHPTTSNNAGAGGPNAQLASQQARRPLNMVKIAVMNSATRSKIANGDLVKRAFANLVRPTSPVQCRCRDFPPQRSRLSLMSKV